MPWWCSSQQRRRVCHFVLVLCCGNASASEDIFEMSLEELRNVNIQSTSRFEENLRDAPATIIVLTQSDLRERGYRDLSYVLDDLPGMDIIRPFGDYWLRNYWRGMRKTISDSYQVLLDGAPLNHLYFNTHDVIASLPMNNIERVEIIYGPASATYGANAFVGIINVVTQSSLSHNRAIDVLSRYGDFATRINDIKVQQQWGDWLFSAAARREDGEMDGSRNNDYEYLNDRYYNDVRLWGPFANAAPFGGQYQSSHAHRAVDLRLRSPAWEFAAQYFVISSGYGNVYVADAAQNDSIWRKPEVAFSARYLTELFQHIQTDTSLRYRQSDVDNDSDFLEAYDVSDSNGQITRVLDYSYWLVDTHSTTLEHNWQWHSGELWRFSAGARVERKHLQKAYNVAFGAATPPETLTTVDDYPFPPQPTGDLVDSNQVDIDSSALYCLARRQFERLFSTEDQLFLHMGLRRDHSESYGGHNSLRGGISYRYQRSSLKILYGEAFNEPSPRELYGGWQGAGSDPSLQPETGKMLDTSIAYYGDNWQAVLSVFEIRSQDTIVNFGGGATNIGERTISGQDLHWQWQSGDSAPVWKMYFYYSRLHANEDKPMANGDLVNDSIGDVATAQTKIGVTWSPRHELHLNMRLRHSAARDTVVTNPVRQVASYVVADLHFLWENALPHTDLSLTVNNVADRHYFHPGIVDANAGDTPGYFDQNNVYHGSTGFYSSLLPQQGRAVFLAFDVHF